MAEQHDEHASFIKTPKQLIIAVVLGFAVPIAIAVLVSQLATSGRRGGGATSEENTAKLIQPVARVELAAGGSGPKALKTGEQVFQGACAACHASGAAGAPKVGDKGAWGPRLGQGLEGLTKSAIAGKGAMPPRGGNPDLAEVEVARAIVFMANQSGANFKEPAAPAAVPAAAPAAAPTAVAAAPAGGKADGKSVYDKACAACHASGAADAPKFGDKAAWEPRIKTGIDSLLKSALGGKGAMPPKGGNASLSDAEVKAAIEHMVAAAK